MFLERLFARNFFSQFEFGALFCLWKQSEKSVENSNLEKYFRANDFSQRIYAYIWIRRVFLSFSEINTIRKKRAKFKFGNNILNKRTFLKELCFRMSKVYWLTILQVYLLMYIVVGCLWIILLAKEVSRLRQDWVGVY